MQLYSGSFVKALRRSMLSAIKSRPALRKEYRLRRQRIPVTTTQVYLALLMLAYCAFFWNLWLNENRPEFPYIFIVIYATGTIVLRSASFSGRLHGAEAAIFAGLPIAESDFFRLQWKKFLLYSSWVFFAMFVAYLSQALHGQNSFLRVVGPSALCALAQWAMVIALALVLLKLWKNFLYWAAIALYVCVPLAFFRPEFAKIFLPITFFFPAGWINKAHTLLLAGNASGFLWLLPSLVIALAGLSLLPRLRSSFNLPKEIKVIDSDPEAEIQETLIASAAPPVRGEGGSRLVAPDWKSAGWLERISAVWLDDDKPVAEFMTGQQMGQWSANWQKATYLAVAAAIGLRFLPAPSLWIGVVALLGVAMCAAPVLGGRWLGFASFHLGTRLTFVAAFYPVDYWRVSKIILKVNTVRWMASALLLVPAITIAGPAFGLTLQQSAMLGLRLIIFGLILQFPAIIVMHSQGTNDTRKFSWQVLVLLLCSGIFILGAFGALFTMLIPEFSWRWGLVALALGLYSILLWWLYGLLYSGNEIDLMHEPKS